MIVIHAGDLGAFCARVCVCVCFFLFSVVALGMPTKIVQNYRVEFGAICFLIQMATFRIKDYLKHQHLNKVRDQMEMLGERRKYDGRQATVHSVPHLNARKWAFLMRI